MGKGGRYLKKKEKKGRGWKTALIVLAVVLVLIGAAGFAAVRYYNSLLDKVNKAEYVEKGASVDDVMDAATFNPDKLSSEDVPETTEATPETVPSETAAPAGS